MMLLKLIIYWRLKTMQNKSGMFAKFTKYCGTLFSSSNKRFSFLHWQRPFLSTLFAFIIWCRKSKLKLKSLETFLKVLKSPKIFEKNVKHLGYSWKSLIFFFILEKLWRVWNDLLLSLLELSHKKLSCTELSCLKLSCIKLSCL